MKRRRSLLHPPLSGALVFLGLVLSGMANPVPAALQPIPEPPYYYVQDEPGILRPAELRGLQALLIEHDRATTEQIVIAVFNSLEQEDLVDYTNRVFTQWKIGKRGKNNGVLLALYWKNRKVRIEVGYGLEPLLTDAKSRQVIEEFLIPELKAGQPGRALSRATLEILRILDSPLIQNGKAQEILTQSGLGSAVRFQKESSASQLAVLVFLIPALIFLLFVFLKIAGADAHYHRGGWYRPRRTLRSGWGGGFGGFGGGGGGGFGGFSGGGGSSGGGGASGSW